MLAQAETPGFAFSIPQVPTSVIIPSSYLSALNREPRRSGWIVGNAEVTPAAGQDTVRGNVKNTSIVRE
jgi:hypothetical protein